jgi:hypothetical protein
VKRQQRQGHPSCAACAHELAILLREEGMSFEDAQALSRSKMKMRRSGGGFACGRCGNGLRDPRLVGPRITPTFRRPRLSLAEVAANAARQAAEERLRRERREAARAARRAGREATG